MQFFEHTVIETNGFLREAIHKNSQALAASAQYVRVFKWFFLPMPSTTPEQKQQILDKKYFFCQLEIG